MKMQCTKHDTTSMGNASGIHNDIIMQRVEMHHDITMQVVEMPHDTVSLVVVSAIFVFPSHKKQCIYVK
jgi:hypothetical protein